jgi:hypothetical protein
MPPVLCLSLPVSLPDSLCLTLSGRLSLAVSLCLTLNVCLSLSLSLCLSISLCLSLCFSLDPRCHESDGHRRERHRRPGRVQRLVHQAGARHLLLAQSFPYTDTCCSPSRSPIQLSSVLRRRAVGTTPLRLLCGRTTRRATGRRRRLLNTERDREGQRHRHRHREGQRQREG